MLVLVVGADLEVHEHDPWVLHGVLDCPKECMLNSLATIAQTVIISQGNVHHGPDHNLAVPDDRPCRGWQTGVG